jgi:hypothetical protein
MKKRIGLVGLLFCLGMLCGSLTAQSISSAQMVALNGTNFAYVNLDVSGNILTASGETATPVAASGYIPPVALMALDVTTGKFEYAHIDTNGNLMVSVGGGSSLALKTNGVANGSQSTLNLVNGGGNVVTDGGTGNITIAGPTAIGFVVSALANGTNIGPSVSAPHAGSLNRCTVVTNASDASTALTIDILKNGTSIFQSTKPNVAANTAGGTVSVFTNLTSTPLTVAQDDVFTINMTSGTTSWKYTAACES